MASLLQTKNLICYRDEKPLFENVNLNLQEGEIVQIVGKNGAGKTTLLRTLTGILKNFQGEILWRGFPIEQQLDHYHSQLFYMGHCQAIKNDLTVFENIRFDIKFHNCSRAEIIAACQQLTLAEKINTLAKHLSQGQRNKIALVKLLLTNAPVWILDEPFAAVDTSTIELLQNLFSQQITRGHAIIFTSHQPFSLKNGLINILNL